MGFSAPRLSISTDERKPVSNLQLQARQANDWVAVVRPALIVRDVRLRLGNTGRRGGGEHGVREVGGEGPGLGGDPSVLQRLA